MTVHGRGWNIDVFKNSFFDDHICCTVLTDKTVKPGLNQAGRSLGLIELYKPLKRNAEEEEAGRNKESRQTDRKRYKGTGCMQTN